MLVKLRVNQATFDDIKARVRSAGQPDRVMTDRDHGLAIDLRDVAIVVDEKEPNRPI